MFALVDNVQIAVYEGNVHKQHTCYVSLRAHRFFGNSAIGNRYRKSHRRLDLGSRSARTEALASSQVMSVRVSVCQCVSVCVMLISELFQRLL